MRRKSKAPVIALCGVLAALAVALMFLGGTVAFAVIACPVLASLVLIPVYCECGWKWGLLWYAAVSALGLLLAPEKEAAILFVFFGYYPMLKKFFGRIRKSFLTSPEGFPIMTDSDRYDHTQERDSIHPPV